MWLMIILKVTKNQSFTLSLEVTFFEKSQGVGGQIDPLAVLGLKWKFVNIRLVCLIFKNSIDVNKKVNFLIIFEFLKLEHSHDKSQFVCMFIMAKVGNHYIIILELSHIIDY